MYEQLFGDIKNCKIINLFFYPLQLANILVPSCFRMYINLLPLLVVCSISQFSHCKKFSDDEITFSTHGNLLLQHAFGPNDQFSSRGEVVFKSSKGTGVFKDKVELSRSDLEKLEKLVKEDGLYFIRSPTKIGGALENNDTSYVSTFVRACYLYGSGLQETITVAVDYSGNVIGLNIVSPRSECKVDDFNGFEGAMFNSTVLVQQQVRKFDIYIYFLICGFVFFLPIRTSSMLFLLYIIFQFYCHMKVFLLLYLI